MPWLWLFIAGLFETAWAVGLKYSDGFTRFWPSVYTLATMAVSIFLLSVALRNLPVGTAYAVWTGIGAVGAALTITFLLRLFVLADEITGVAVFSIFTGLLAPLICVTVFVIALIGGYAALFIDPPQEA